MKIVALCWRDSRHPQGGGSERYLEEVTAGLVAAGHEVIYRSAAVAGQPSTSSRNGVVHQRRGGPYTVYLWALWDVWRSRRGRGPIGRCPDVVLDTHNGVPFFAHCVLPGRVILIHHHCHREQWPVAGPLIGRLGWFLESQVSPRIHRHCPWVTVSRSSRAELIAHGIAPEQVHIIANGVGPLPAGLRPCPAAEPRLVVIARLVPHKNIEHAIDTVAQLRATGLAVEVDIIGSGWWEQRLRRHAAAHGVAEAVHFHGHLPEAEKDALLARAWVQLLPSRKEGWGIVVLEAARLGIPTVAYRSAGGVQDSIRDGQTGLLVDSPAELTAATAQLLTDASLRARLGSAARQRAADYSWAATRAGWVDLLRRFAHETPTDPAATSPPTPTAP